MKLIRIIIEKRKKVKTKRKQLEFVEVQLNDYKYFLQVLNEIGKHENVDEMKKDIEKRKEKIQKNIDIVCQKFVDII